MLIGQAPWLVSLSGPIPPCGLSDTRAQ